MEIKIQCPAKINLTLEILNKREDGFHNIQSIMQTISLYDYLTINVEDSQKFEIKLSGTSDEIPYDEKNLVHKAILLFIERVNLQPKRISVFIEKNIPIAAGLAGGSADAAGVLYGLNKLFEDVLSRDELHCLCAKLGSDLNFCLEGGCQLATSRGEVLQPLPFYELPLSLIKPKKLGISAKEAYVKCSQLEDKPNFNKTKEMLDVLQSDKISCEKIEELLQNDLEIALIKDYQELSTIKKSVEKSLMSGSGSTFFSLKESCNCDLGNDYWYSCGLKTVAEGVGQVLA